MKRMPKGLRFSGPDGNGRLGQGPKTHSHTFSRSHPEATVQTCQCGRFQFTENAGPAIEGIGWNENPR